MLSQEQRKQLLELVGSNIIKDEDGFFGSLEELMKKGRWKAKDLQLVNLLIKDGMGYMLQTLFRDWNSNENYRRYYREFNFFKPVVNINNFEQIRQEMVEGEFQEEVLKKYGVNIENIDEFSETREDRKIRQKENKEEISNLVRTKTKMMNKTKECKIKG